MPPHRVARVRQDRTHLLMRQAVRPVSLAGLTRTLMPRHHALCAHRVITVVLARRRALLVRLVSMTMTGMRLQHVCPAVLVTSLRRRR